MNELRIIIIQIYVYNIKFIKILDGTINLILSQIIVFIYNL